jgi:hypothetical protein
MDISANELTQWAKTNLGYIGVRLNRVNNIPYGKRKGTIQKGWADLQGYSSEGKYVMVEIKKLGDKLSKEQIERFTDCWKCGSLVYICTEVDNKPALVEWTKIKL